MGFCMRRTRRVSTSCNSAFLSISNASEFRFAVDVEERRTLPHQLNTALATVSFFAFSVLFLFFFFLSLSPSGLSILKLSRK